MISTARQKFVEHHVLPVLTCFYNAHMAFLPELCASTFSMQRILLGACNFGEHTASDLAFALDRMDQAIPRRPLGRTGLSLSIIGFGASPLGSVFEQIDEDEGVRSVHEAFRIGINYFDVSP